MDNASHNISLLKKKAARYCAWQDRCTKEVRDKLIQLGALTQQTTEIITWLEKENYLNNERFAFTFVRSKFNNNQWGRNRITIELKTREIDADTIQDALEQIKENDYRETVSNLALKKWESLKDEDPYIKKQKTAAYLVRKGFEMDIAWEAADKTGK